MEGEDERESVTRLVLSDDWSRRHRRAAVVVSTTRDGGKLAVKVLDAYSGAIRTTAVLGPQQDVSGRMLDDMFPPFHMQACKIVFPNSYIFQQYYSCCCACSSH